jgi:hypothetical protein
MAFQNVLRQITVILYRLKRQFGLPVTIYQYVSQTNNVETGEITRNYNVLKVRRAPVLPNHIERHFVYDLTFIAANNNFVGGGLFDQKSRVLLFDAKDLPKGFVFSNDDHIEFDDQRYEIKTIDLLEKKKGFLLRVSGIDSSETVG